MDALFLFHDEFLNAFELLIGDRVTRGKFFISGSWEFGGAFFSVT